MVWFLPGPRWFGLVLTWSRMVWFGSDLVEDGLVWAEEAPLEHLLLAVGVRHRVADVEHLPTKLFNQ